jgi:hypothetical protein
MLLSRFGPNAPRGVRPASGGDAPIHPLPVWRRQRQTAPMAVVLRLTVSPATQEQFNVLDDRVGEAMMAAGGPPAGLMSHVVYPEGEGFVVAGVWRSESEGRDYVDGPLRELIADMDLTPGETNVVPAWSFARP